MTKIIKVKKNRDRERERKKERHGEKREERDPQGPAQDEEEIKMSKRTRWTQGKGNNEFLKLKINLKAEIYLLTCPRIERC